MTVSSRNVETETVRGTTVVSSVKFTEADDSFPYRIVGSYEYGNALERFNRLVEQSQPEEIQVYDALIRNNPEYSFVSGVVSNEGVADSGADQPLNEKYVRHSLAWMMALARVELGATISMFGESKDPFGAVLRNKYGANEYFEILLDDLAAHLIAAERDQEYQEALKPKKALDNQTLAYLKRTQLIDDMLTKVISSGKSDVVSRAMPYAQKAQRYVSLLVEKVEVGTGTYSNFSGTITQGSYADDTLIAARFVNRENLLYCQQNLERNYPAPQPIASPLQ